ncbi:MAG TPA: MFS transporter [Candidatus Limnocylindria bacterium]|nr:MFS transporter [Candidatus Limnocylindria bacterium]
MVALFSVAGFIEVLAYGQVTAFTPLYLPHLGIPDGEVAFWVGAIASFSNLVGLPFLPFWGALADRYGRKPLIIRSFVTAAVALGLTVIAPNVWVFAFSRAFQSLGLGNTGLMLATLAEHAPATRTAFAFGLVNGANPLGAFVGPLIGGPVVDRFGFPTLIAADALALAAVVALLTFGYRDGFVPRGSTGSLFRMAGDGVMLIVRSPRLRALFPALFLLFAGWMLAYIYVPLVVARLYSGSDPATAVGIVLGAGGLAVFVASPAIGALADRFGRPRTLFAGCAILAAVWILPFFTRDLVTFTIAWAIVNGLAAGLFSVSFTMLSASTGDATRGRVMTFAYLPANMGFVIGPGIGSVIASVDVFLVFPAAAVLTAVGLFAVSFAWRQPMIVEEAT